MRLFYGWVIVAAACAIYATVAGPVTSFGVFVKPMAQEFEWTRWSTVMAFALYFVMISIASIASGHLSDRYGPKPLVLVGGALLGLGLFLTSRVNSLWQFYMCFSVISGTGFAFIFIPITVTISRWFISRRGLALGIFYAGGGVGGLILSPLIQSWILDYGWRSAWVIVASVAWCVVISLALLLKRDPAEVGLRPLEKGARGETGGASPAPVPAAVRDHTLSQAMRTRSLWIFSFASLLIFLGIMMAQVNMVPYATDVGVAETTAAAALGVAAAFNAAGRLGMGAVSDRVGTKRAFAFSVGLAAAALFFLNAARQPWTLFLFAVPFGFAYGGCLPQTPRVISELFGTRSMGGIMGINGIFGTMGPAFGPVLGAFIYDQTGGYFLAFLLGGLAILIGLGLLLSLPLPGRAATTAVVAEAAAPVDGP